MEAGSSSLAPAPRDYVHTPGDDPFLSPTDPSFRSMNRRNDSSRFEAAHAGLSSASLLSTPDSDADTARDDDELHLTANKSQPSPHGHNYWPGDFSVDSERSGGVTPRSRQRTMRYSTTPSPLHRTGTALKTAFRRASMRVANVRGHDTSIRLPDDDEDVDDLDSTSEDIDDIIQGEPDGNFIRRTQTSTPLRGWALGFLGPTNPLRLRLYHMLSHLFTEPIILTLIIFDAIALVLQASRSLLLPPSQTPTTEQGYFHAWEDYVIFVLFVLFTTEALARICVSGLLLDPEVPTSSLLAVSFSTKSGYVSAPTSSASTVNVNATSSRSGSVVRGLSLKRLYSNLTRPFALPSNVQPSSVMQDPMRTIPPSSTLQFEKATTHSGVSSSSLSQLQQHSRDPSHPTFLSRAMKSDVPKSHPSDIISLPFRLNVQAAREKVVRNLPYLRQSWGRIDFLAIVGFWVSFILATIGVERGTYHFGIFRAMSVLRIARLLAITSGTATIMRSLKIARPLLASVTYFVVFAMVLFSVIGVQSFKGSLRRSCHLLPALGEATTQLLQSCGGHINATTLASSPYLQLDGTPGDVVKGFICPLGQICQEGNNPYGGVESFDTVYYATLQVIILASANTWSQVMYQIIESEYFVSCFFFVVGILVLNFWLFNLFVAVITNTFSAIRSDTRRSAFGAATLGPIVEELEEGWTVVAGRHVGQNGLKIFYSYTRWCWVFLALASLAVQATTTADMSLMHIQILEKSELVLTIAFDIEIIIRVAADNWLDLILAIGSSVVQIPVIRSSEVYPWLTVFQLGRFYRVILEVPRMKPLMLTVFGNLYGLANMTLFLMLVNFLAALIGIQLLQGDMTGTITMNFGQLFNSFLAVYQIFSSENWTTVLYDATAAELNLGQAVIVCTFLTCWLLFANFIVLQMFIAVINENFSVAEEAKRGKQASDYWAHHQQQQVTQSRWMRKLNPYRWVKAEPVTVKVENLPSNLVLPMQKTLVEDYPLPGQDRRSASVRSARTDDVALVDLRQVRLDTATPQDPAEHESERHLEKLTGTNPEMFSAHDFSDILHERRAQKADFIRDHPTYDRTFWVFSQKNRLRRLCQKIVRPAGGERIFGTPPSDVAHTLFQLVIFLAILGGVITEGIATSLYRRDYYMHYGIKRNAWFNIAEATFGIILFVEFLIKIIADGLFFTPNAYIRSIWNILDFIILTGVLVNATFMLIFVGGLSRFIHSLKALRALRFVTLIDKMRSTFENLILSGVTRILDAAILAVLYLIPFSVWGTSIFAGLMNGCNDNSVQDIGGCTNEYVNTLYGDNFGFFGKGQQPQTNASQVNAIFFVIYNLLGAVVILTLFVSIIIGNFSSRTGSAFLTQPQREWIDLQKLIKRQKPSKRPQSRPTARLRAWCYDRANHKHGWWSRMMTLLFVIQIIALMTEAFTPQPVLEAFRDDFSVFLTSMYVLDTTIRFYVALGSFVTTLTVRLGSPQLGIQLLQKLFLVSIAFKLVQRTDSLNQLFKTGTASLPVILNLLGLWLILFLFFAIMYMEVFAMTKWASAETSTQNYQTMGSALLMLAFMSTGTITYPRCTYLTDGVEQTDCGSTAWAFSYIFVNMFTGVVVENFSYVFQSTGGAKSITRGEMRAFKKVWTEFSDSNTGLLGRANLVPFLGKLSGIFEVRIYPQESSIAAIVDTCYDESKRRNKTGGISARKLNQMLNKTDHNAIRKRRMIYTRLYHEASIMSHQGKGISFTDMLLLLAHHKLIVDREALVLVTDLVNLDKVRSLLKMISLRRRFLLEREQALNAPRGKQAPLP
ncbi:Ion transport protein-domain-containing protein [Melanogaster broomeanus]|nr:Ion transport protein-domain-containing protein [Melanogaster broomeanus]